MGVKFILLRSVCETGDMGCSRVLHSQAFSTLLLFFNLKLTLYIVFLCYLLLRI